MPILKPHDQNIPDTLINENQASTFLKVTPRTLQAWRYRGGGPRYIKISSRAVRYRVTDLTAWIESKLQGSTSEIAGGV